jgi:hypothetical protein
MNRVLEFKNIFIKFSLLFGVLALISIIGGIFYYASFGFELSDETFYLYHSNYYDPNKFITSDFGLLNKIVCFGSPTLINLRYAKLIYQIISVLIFTWSLLKYLKHKSVVLTKTTKIFVYTIIFVTSFGHYDYLPMTLSYNSWSLILMLLAFSLMFIEFLKKTLIVSVTTSFLMGVLCFCFFITKFPNSIIVMGLYAFFNIFYIKKDILVKILGFIVGLLITFFLILKNTHNFFALIENYRITIFDIKHAESNLYFKQIYKILIVCSEHKTYSFLFISILSIILLVGCFLIRNIKNNTSSKKYIYYYMLVISELLLSVIFIKGNGHKTYNDFISVAILIVNPYLFVYLYKHDYVTSLSFFKNELNIIIVSLLITPVLLMLGTNNAFYYSVSPTMVFAFSSSLIYLLKTNKNYIYYLSVYNVALCLFIITILYFGAIKKPYRQTNLNDKNYPLTFSPLLQGISESRDAFIDYSSVNYILNNLNKEHKPFLTFFEFYGFTVINNNSISTDLPLSSQERSLEYDDYMLKRCHIMRAKPLLLLPGSIIKNSKFIQMFQDNNIYLNQNYKLVYKYQFISNNETINFYKSIVK